MTRPSEVHAEYLGSCCQWAGNRMEMDLCTRQLSSLYRFTQKGSSAPSNIFQRIVDAIFLSACNVIRRMRRGGLVHEEVGVAREHEACGGREPIERQPRRAGAGAASEESELCANRHGVQSRWRQRNDAGEEHGPNIADERKHQGEGSAGAG